MSMYSSRRGSRQASRAQLGHLKLSVYEEASTLVVHIIEVRGLLRKENAPFDTYVKIYLLPDPQKLTKEKTKIVKNQKDPVFNEKFSFTLNEEDQEKKLFISVWTHHFASRNDMIGCMTFLLSDLVGPCKGLNGWYRLLDEVKGRNENAQVPNSITKYSQLDFAQTPGGHQIFAVTLVQGEHGYGFSVRGHNPVQITKVVEDSPAYESDIKVDDVIMEVEGTDVTRANGELVNSIIKRCPKTLQLILRRPVTSAAVRKTSFLALPPSLQSRSFGSSNLRMRSLSSHAISLSQQQDEPLTLGVPVSGRYSASQYLAPEIHDYRRNSTPFPIDFGLTQPVSTYGTSVGEGDSRLEPDPYISHTYSHRRRHHKSRSKARNHIPEEPSVDSQSHSSGSADKVDRGEKERAGSSTHRFRRNAFSSLSRPPRYSSRTFMGSQEQLRPQGQSSIYGRGFETITPAMMPERYALTQPVYPEEEGGVVDEGWVQRRSKQPPTLRPPRITVEVEGGGDSRRVVRTASLNPSLAHSGQSRLSGRPGGQSSLSQVSDGAQSASASVNMTPDSSQSSGSAVERSGQVATATNTQEEGPISWESLGSLGQTRQRAMNNLVNAELAFSEELTVGMETYIEPLKRILPEATHTSMFIGLSELHELSGEISSELKRRKVLYTSPDSPLPFFIPHVADIYRSRLDKLVKRLKLYMENCHKSRQEIAIAFTNEEFTKHVQDSVVVQKKPSIYSFVEAGKEYFPKLCKALMALVYFTPVFHEDQKHLSTIVDALLKLSSDKELVRKWEEDQEAMKSMQIRVGFSTKVRPVIMRVPGRMLLLESEMTMMENRKKKKVLVLLFSDMMLITRRQGKVITTIEDPIFLNNLTVQDINCEATEFHIQTADRTFSRVMRTSSESKKREWMDKISERVSDSLTSRSRAPAREKGHNIKFKDSLLPPSKQLLAGSLAGVEPKARRSSRITAIPEGAGVKSEAGAAAVGNGEEDWEHKTSTLTRKKKTSTPPKDSPLKRGISKRRSW